MLKVGSTYDWAGVELNDGEYAFEAVSLHSSTDLESWTFVKAMSTPTGSGDLAPGDWVGRPDLLSTPQPANTY